MAQEVIMPSYFCLCKCVCRRCHRNRQMIKGVRVGGMKAALSYLDTLEVPIIENTPNEEDLKDSMADAMQHHPDAAAVLVRRHGIYVWGKAGRHHAGTGCTDLGPPITKGAIGRRQRRRLR